MVFFRFKGKKNMTDIKEIIEFAIKKEIEAYELYSGSANKTKNPAAKKLLEELAEEERGHKSILQNFSKADEMLNFKLEPVQDLKLSDHLLASPIDENSDIQAVLTFAMKAEKAAFELYTQMSKAAIEGKDSKIFQNLAQMELIRKNKLESLYDDMFYTDN
ncbi:MAG: ferritin-like domain-containing protein [Promethearchaeota archaeon]|jgi:rubrerythrin